MAGDDRLAGLGGASAPLGLHLPTGVRLRAEPYVPDTPAGTVHGLLSVGEAG